MRDLGLETRVKPMSDVPGPASQIPVVPRSPTRRRVPMIGPHDRKHHPQADDTREQKARGAEGAPILNQHRARDEETGQYEAREDAIRDLLQRRDADQKLRNLDTKLKIVRREPSRDEVDA